MISTQRTIRPFADLDELDSVLDGIRLRVGDERIGPLSSVWVSSEEYCSAPVRLELAPDDRAMDEFVDAATRAVAVSGYSAEQTELVVVASSSYLKIVEVLERRPCVDLAESQRVLGLTNGTRPRSLRSPRSGARLDVYLCLAQDIEPRPLRAWRRGTWLARTHFDIKSDLSGSNFRLRSLSEEDRVRLKLPKGSIRHVELESGMSIDGIPDEPSVTIWVDAQVLARLSSKPGSPAARLFQTELFLDVVEAVLGDARKSKQFWTSAAEDFDGSLFGQVLNALASGGVAQPLERRRKAREALLDLARHRPDRFLAEAASGVGLLRANLEALEQ
jgi:hypothetical protein